MQQKYFCLFFVVVKICLRCTVCGDLHFRSTTSSLVMSPLLTDSTPPPLVYKKNLSFFTIMSSNVPFDEEEDAASVTKGLAMLHTNPELGAGEAFKGRAPLRSSLQTLQMPFAYAPLEDDEDEGARRSFRISEPKILEVL